MEDPRPSSNSAQPGMERFRFIADLAGLLASLLIFTEVHFLFLVRRTTGMIIKMFPHSAARVGARIKFFYGHMVKVVRRRLGFGDGSRWPFDFQFQQCG